MRRYLWHKYIRGLPNGELGVKNDVILRVRLNGALRKWPFSIFFKYQFWWPQNLFFVFAFTLNWKIEYFVGHQGIICVTQTLWEHFCWHKNIKFVHQLTYDIQNYHMSLNVKISFIFILDMSISHPIQELLIS